MEKITLCFLTCILFYTAFAQPQVPFHKGVNLTGWFQVENARQIQFKKYTKKDFEQIKSLGCDAIRLPINLHFMTNGAPNYQLDPIFLGFLDEAVNWAEDLQIHLILDNHTFEVSADTDPNVGIILEKVWTQMAAHFKNRSNYIYYEVLNEPHGISDLLWNQIQQKVVKAIRTVDTKHTIIIGPAGWNSYNNLQAMPNYDDSNLIYTFHFYDPFLFTHQGASWVSPSMEPVANIPFPYQANRMPLVPNSLKGTWIEFAYNGYPADGTAQKVRALIDIAARFSTTRNVPVFCGEFGVYIPNSTPTERTNWYSLVRNYLEEKNIPWTIWDYHGGFGLYQPNGNDFFDHDLNVPLLTALDFNVPPQTTYVQQPDSIGFPIFRDCIEQYILESSYGSSQLDFYEKNQPFEGNYCINWANATQYGVIGFDFKPNKDLSKLVANGYGLTMMARSNHPFLRLDVRWLDTKTSATDRPWRRTFTLNLSNLPRDGQWHAVHIPLTQFQESGAWDNGWFNPEGKFDWKAVDRLEIVAEHGALSQYNFWFDQISITKPGLVSTSTLDSSKWKVYPNPTTSLLFIESNAKETFAYQLSDQFGKIVQQASFHQTTRTDIAHLPKGVYYLTILRKHEALGVQKIVKL